MQICAIQITAPCRARQNKRRARINAIVKWYTKRKHKISQCEEPSSTTCMSVSRSEGAQVQIEFTARAHACIQSCVSNMRPQHVHLLVSDLLRLLPEVQETASFAHPASRLLRKHDRHEMVQAPTVSRHGVAMRHHKTDLPCATPDMSHTQSPGHGPNGDQRGMHGSYSKIY
jgi:hypothetical protein